MLGFVNGKPAVLVIVFREPGANIIETVDRVRGSLPQLDAALPAAMDVSIVLDRTPTIRASLRDVEGALILAAVLVVLVVFAFLRNWRATLIPALAVPCIAHRHVRGDVPLWVQPQQPLPDGTHHRDGFRGGRCHRRARKHLASARARDGSQAGSIGRGKGSFVHRALDEHLAGGRFGPSCSWAGCWVAFLRVRGDALRVAIMVSLALSLTTTPMMCAALLKPETGAARSRLYRRASEWG